MNLSRLLNQTITYWASPVPDGYGGYTYDAPEAIVGRWEDKQELFIDAAGNEVKSNAVVYLTQDVSLGGFLALGDYTDSANYEEDPVGSASGVDGAREIRAFEKSPDIRGDYSLRKAWL